jgi:hypothetical protein
VEARNDTKADGQGRFKLGAGSQFYLELLKGEPKWPLKCVPDENEGKSFLVYDERPLRTERFTMLEVFNASPGSEWYTILAQENEHVGYHARTRPVLLFETDFLGAVLNGEYQLPDKVKNDESKARAIDVRGFRFVKLSLQLREGVAGFTSHAILPTLKGMDGPFSESVQVVGRDYGAVNNIAAATPVYAAMLMGEMPPREVVDNETAIPTRYEFVSASIQFIAPSPATEMDLGAGLGIRLVGYP